MRMQNVGNTDVLSPYAMLITKDNISLRLVDGEEAIASPKVISFLGLSSEGPAGIISPGSVAIVNFKILPHHDDAMKTTLQLRLPKNSSAPHCFTRNRLSLKPNGVASAVWDIVWRNFISSAGTTQQSLEARLSYVASQFSTAWRREYSIDRLMSNQLQVAFGMTLGKLFPL